MLSIKHNPIKIELLAYNVLLALREHRLLQCFECVLSICVRPTVAHMDLREVTPSQEAADHELLLKIEKNDVAFQSLNPGLSLCQAFNVEFYRPLLRHENKAEHLLLRSVFEVVLLKAAVFNL